MTRRLLLGYLSITVVVLLLLEVPLAVFYAQRERDRMIADVERDATVIATIYEDDLEQGRPLDPAPAEEYARRTDARVVVTDDGGISRVDTEQPVPRDLSTRPEIAAALGGERSSGIRESETLGTDILFVAVPVASGGVVHGTVRVTLDASEVDRAVHRFWLVLVAVAVVVLLAMAVIGWAIARSVTRPIRELREAAGRFAEGDLTAGVGDGASGPPEIRELADSMATMATRLSVLLEEQRAFVADASHQLRTPLTALRLRLENLQTRVDGDTAADLDAAIAETERLAALVSDLLQLARADRPTATVEIDVARVVAERVDTWTAVAELQGVGVRAVGIERAVAARAVPGAVEQVLDNALDNALAVSPPGTDVAVEVVRVPTGVQVRVVDHGPGLSDDDKQRATRRFWRGEQQTPGTGLGLAIAGSLAAASGGRLDLVDTPGGGLTVVLEVPSAP